MLLPLERTPVMIIYLNGHLLRIRVETLMGNNDVYMKIPNKLPFRNNGELEFVHFIMRNGTARDPT